MRCAATTPRAARAAATRAAARSAERHSGAIAASTAAHTCRDRRLCHQSHCRSAADEGHPSTAAIRRLPAARTGGGEDTVLQGQTTSNNAAAGIFRVDPDYLPTFPQQHSRPMQILPRQCKHTHSAGPGSRSGQPPSSRGPRPVSTARS